MAEGHTPMPPPVRSKSSRAPNSVPPGQLPPPRANLAAPPKPKTPLPESIDIRIALNEVESNQLSYGDTEVEGKQLYLVRLEGHRSLVACPDKSSWGEEDVQAPDGRVMKRRVFHRQNLYVEWLPIWASSPGEASDIFIRYNGILSTGPNAMQAELAPGHEKAKPE